MASDTYDAVDLVTSACDLLDRHGEAGAARSATVSDVVLLRDELREYSATCADGALGDDLVAMATELERLMARHEHRPERAGALAG